MRLITIMYIYMKFKDIIIDYCYYIYGLIHI